LGIRLILWLLIIRVIPSALHIAIFCPSWIHAHTCPFSWIPRILRFCDLPKCVACTVLGGYCRSGRQLETRRILKVSLPRRLGRCRGRKRSVLLSGVQLMVTLLICVTTVLWSPATPTPARWFGNINYNSFFCGRIYIWRHEFFCMCLWRVPDRLLNVTEHVGHFKASAHFFSNEVQKIGREETTCVSYKGHKPSFFLRINTWCFTCSDLQIHAYLCCRIDTCVSIDWRASDILYITLHNTFNPWASPYCFRLLEILYLYRNISCLLIFTQNPHDTQNSSYLLNFPRIYSKWVWLRYKKYCI
jgi:hypothetical protein